MPFHHCDGITGGGGGMLGQQPFQLLLRYPDPGVPAMNMVHHSPGVAVHVGMPLQGLQADQGLMGNAGQSPTALLGQAIPTAVSNGDGLGKQTLKTEFWVEGQGAGAGRLHGVNTITDTRPIDCKSVFMEATLKVMNTA